jgi:hypothetical protein
MVYSVHVKQPQSIVGRSWNRVMDGSPIVQLAFIVLKLTGVITWSWWWVLSPLCFGGILFALSLCAVLVLMLWALFSLPARSVSVVPFACQNEAETTDTAQ